MGIYPPFHEVRSSTLTFSRRYSQILKPLLLCIASAAILSLGFRFRHVYPFPPSSPSPSSSPSQPASGLNYNFTLSPNSTHAIQNRTLGFGDIYLMNMPSRTDKRDSIRLLTSFTNLSYTVIPGVDGKEIPHVAWPGLYNKAKTTVAGCWRAHMNAAASILDNNLSSALIIEDDSDWDISLKTQLTLFALGSRHILNSSTSSEPLSPYGDGWDMLWLGHCAQDKPPKPFPRFFIANDTTVPPPSGRWTMWNPEEDLTYDIAHNRTTRVVYRSSGGICAYAYALSYSGAQKMLFHLSYSNFNGPVDSGQSSLCKRGLKGEIDFKCVGVYPGLVHAAFLQNDNVGDPDSPDTPPKDRDKDKTTPSAPNLVYSVRHNLKNLIEGKELESKFPGEEKIGDLEMRFDKGTAD